MNITANEVLLASLSPELKQALQGAAKALEPVLDDIHSQPATSKDYFADYLRVLSYKPREAKFVAIAMLYAGANPLGVAKAVESLNQRTAIHLK
jgi:hypothetical protein